FYILDVPKNKAYQNGVGGEVVGVGGQPPFLWGPAEIGVRWNSKGGGSPAVMLLVAPDGFTVLVERKNQR
ncbi:hypothetical protein, partial [Aeromonas sp. Marseille-Q7275]